MFLLFILILFSGLTTAEVRFCDKVFQFLNRTDESEQICRFQESSQITDQSSLLASSEECVDGKSRPGLTCETECVPFQDWCDPDRGTEVVTRCGALLYQASVCRNGSFWDGKPCGRKGRRCTGWWPGQCDIVGGAGTGLRKGRGGETS